MHLVRDVEFKPGWEHPPRYRLRRGTALVYTILIMTMLIGFVSFGVDFGRVQLAKTELQQAADAASRAAAAQLTNGIVATQNAAVLWGGYNTADGTSVVIDPTNDVDFLTWNTTTRTFVVLSGAARSTANAVRVKARRLASRGTAVNLAFGKVIGVATCDANAFSIALAGANNNDYSFVGLTAATVKNNTTTLNGYDSSKGAYGGANITTDGFLGSNGTVTLGPGTVTISSGIYMKAASTLTTSGTISYGARTNNASNITCPTPTAGSYATTNDNGRFGLPANGASASFSSGAFSIPGGNYYIDNFNMSGGTLTFTAPTVIYMNGPFTLSGGTIVVSSGKPSDLVIKTVTASTLAISTPTTIYIDIQSPTSTVTISSTCTVYGRIIAGTLNLTGGGNYHGDINLPVITGLTQRPGAAGISVVK